MGLMDLVIFPSWKEGTREAIEPMRSVTETATQLGRQSSALGRQKGKPTAEKNERTFGGGANCRKNVAKKENGRFGFPKRPFEQILKQFTEAERSRPAGPWGRGRLRIRPLGRHSATCSHPLGSRKNVRIHLPRSDAG